MKLRAVAGPSITAWARSLAQTAGSVPLELADGAPLVLAGDLATEHVVAVAAHQQAVAAIPGSGKGQHHCHQNQLGDGPAHRILRPDPVPLSCRQPTGPVTARHDHQCHRDGHFRQQDPAVPGAEELGRRIDQRRGGNDPEIGKAGLQAVFAQGFAIQRPACLELREPPLLPVALQQPATVGIQRQM